MLKTKSLLILLIFLHKSSFMQTKFLSYDFIKVIVSEASFSYTVILQNGFVEYIDAQIKAVSKDLERYPNPKVAHSQHLKYLAKYYFDLWNKLRDDFVNKYDKNLVTQFKKYQECGERTSALTHRQPVTMMPLRCLFQPTNNLAGKICTRASFLVWLQERIFHLF